jgi:hypothetical protein
MVLPFFHKILQATSVFVILVCIILAAGCSTPPAPAGEKPPPQNILVEYNRSGGIAGFDDRMVVFEKGDVVYSRRPPDKPGAFNLSPDELAELGEILERADFPSLAPDYPAATPGADYFSYEITYKGRTVTTETGGVPPELVPVIMRLDSLLTSYS